MPDLSEEEELEARSLRQPPWHPGDTLRLDIPRPGSALFGSAGSLHTLRRLFLEDGFWMAVVDTSAASLFAGRFSLVSSPRPRIKTNHKLGAPKGKLP